MHQSWTEWGKKVVSSTDKKIMEAGAFLHHGPASFNRRLKVESWHQYIPKSNNLTSLAAFSPSNRRFLSIIFDRSAAALSSALVAQPILKLKNVCYSSTLQVHNSRYPHTNIFLHKTDEKTHLYSSLSSI